MSTDPKSKPNKQHEKKEKEKVGSASVHTTPARAKRPLSEVANSSAEEIVMLSTQMEEISTDLKELSQNVSTLMNKSETMMTKQDMKTFIATTVEEIMVEINKNIEVTIELKVNEKTKKLSDDVKLLQDENNDLKEKLITLQDNHDVTKKTANLALKIANQNEQYSRKHNIKIMDITEEPLETETSLLRSVINVLEQQEVRLTPDQVVAIHRIPSKKGNTKPVLLKVKNNNIKTEIMKKRKEMKSMGHRLVDDVTRLNTACITELNAHPLIDAGWYFNGAVFGKTKTGKRLKLELNDDIDTVIAQKA